MNSYKPYSYLIKKLEEPASLTSCFVVWVPAGKKLDEPRTTTTGNLSTFTYAILSDANQPVGRQEEYENELNWDGKLHYIKIVIGSGSGSNGGTSENSSDLNFE